MASSYQPGRPRRTASSITASRPTWRSTTSPGTLPARKPGTRISRPSSAAALRSSRSSASLGTSTSRRTRESPSSVVLVVTAAAMRRLTVPCECVNARERSAAWIVTGPPGHFWSATADIVVLWTRYLWARARR